MAKSTLSHTTRATNIRQKRDAEPSDMQYAHEQDNDAPGASRNAQPSENLGALYETIFIHLQQVITLDVADDTGLCSRIARIAADQFREYRNEENKLAVAVRCEKLFDIEALLHGAHDVSDAHAERRALLVKAMQAVDRATDILGTSPDWNADDLMASREIDRAAMDSEPARATATDDERLDLGRDANYEVTLLADVLQKEIVERDEHGDIGPIARGILARIKTLSDVVYEAAFSDLEERAEVSTMRRKMAGAGA